MREKVSHKLKIEQIVPEERMKKWKEKKLCAENAWQIFENWGNQQNLGCL